MFGIVKTNGVRVEITITLGRASHGVNNGRLQQSYQRWRSTHVECDTQRLVETKVSKDGDWIESDAPGLCWHTLHHTQCPKGRDCNEIHGMASSRIVWTAALCDFYQKRKHFYHANWLRHQKGKLIESDDRNQQSEKDRLAY